MIDTLRLNLTDCEIKRSAPIVIQPGVYEQSSNGIGRNFDLFINTDGKIIKGSKAYLNDDKFNLTINPSMESNSDDYYTTFTPKIFKRILPDGDLFDFKGEDEVTGIFLQTSLPRILNNTNVKTLSKEDQIKAISSLEKRLKQVGIKTNLMNANLSRLDTFTNIKTDHTFFSYTNLFSLMECSRMKSVGWGDESFLWKNGQQELMIYDKIKEMKQKDPGIKLGSSNVMRFENRLLKKRKIVSTLRMTKLSEVYNSYQDLKEFHRSEIEKKIFKFNPDEVEALTANDLKTKLLKAKEIFGKRYFYNYCFGLGVYSLSKASSYDFLKEVVSDIEGGNDVKVRMRKSRMIKAIIESKMFFGMIEGSTVNFKTNIELYNEIRQKFYKQVS